VQPDRLGMGEPGRRDLGRPVVVVQRPRRPPAAGVLLGKLSSSQRFGGLIAAYAVSRSRSWEKS